MMEGLLKVQLNLHKSISKGLSNFKKSPKDRITQEYIEVRLEILERDWLLFRDNNTKLCDISKPEELLKTDYVTNDIYESTEDNYSVYKSALKTALKKFMIFTEAQPGKDSNGVKVGPALRLPKITIPVFSGSYSEWTTFRDLFLSLVHNNTSLDNVQKLHYLKTHLTGEAEQLIRYTPITHANYSECWALLEKRFNNKKYLANSILKRLFQQKRLFVESAAGLKDLLDTTTDCLNALKNIDIDVSTWDIIIIHITSFKLDPETRKQWELYVSSNDPNELPSLEQFKSYIENRFRALEFVDAKKPFSPHTSGSQIKPRTFLATKTYDMKCEFCPELHKLCFCKEFAKLDCSKRREFVMKNSICFNCLGRTHKVYDCNNPSRCRLCNKKHHSLLHLENEPVALFTTTGEDTTASTSTDPIVSCLSTQKINKSGQVILATALVNARSDSRGHHILRVLLDQGSQACFITEAAVQLLQLKKSVIRGTVTGLGGDKTITSKSVVTVELQSLVDKKFNIIFQAYVLKNVTSYIPEKRLETIDWPELENLCLADPQFNVPNKIDILLGANIMSSILKEGIKKNPNASLVAQNTTLGWILSGTVHNNTDSHNLSITVMHSQVNENDFLKKFWEIEEQSSRKNIWTEEEQKCEEIFKETTKRTPEGRYIVKLPFREPQPSCLGGNSRQIAIAKFKSLEKRLLNDLDLKGKYADVINEYLLLGHMRPVTSKDTNKDKAVYLPHHAVVKNERTTTKVRVVFNASSKNNLGVSLNDDLMIGPKLQPDLRHLVLSWRVHPFVIIADIVKMYRQVRVAKEDAVFQRIVWRENPESEIQDYELLTVTFGTASAPYLAVKALNQVSLDEGKDFPLAADKVINSFYMDDLMLGCSDINKGIQMCKEMSKLLLRGGFELQKWNSNNKEILTGINRTENVKDKLSDEIKETKSEQTKGENEESNDKEQTENEQIVDLKVDNLTKILGLVWDRSEDIFQYKFKLPKTSVPETKRSILSTIAQLYDPLGWIAPTIVIAKIFIQKLWLTGLTWDETIPTDLNKKWLTYRNELQELTSIKIPRWVGLSEINDKEKCELHGFCDASKSAYAAVVYLRVIDNNGQVHISVLTAKTRVAPIKQVCIPRLELCGAVLLSRLITEVAEVLNISKDKITAWTDSTIVLSWLSSHPSKWKTFVANRTSEILTNLEACQWFHVQSKENPADCASRGVQPADLKDNQLWFSGPQFLYSQNITYRKPKELGVNNLEEAVKSHHINTEENLLERYSTLQKLIRIVSYIRRILDQKVNRTNYIRKGERELALICCIKKVQRETYGEEYKQLKGKGFIEYKNSQLRTLSTFLDENDIIRVGGRIQKSTLTEETRHPIVLPRDSHLTKLIISDAHLNTLHGGAQLTMNYLRSAYWIIGMKNQVKSYIHKCIPCVRQNAKIQHQIMGSLPAVRCTPARAFVHSGVDYAGPISIRTTKGRGNRSHKGYICLFVCMVTRAIHLEVVSDMSTAAFIAAFRRFVSRRGHCAKLWSDNGTTFVGASKELKQLKEIQRDIAGHLESYGTEWNFIPPHAPNFGGLWEAGIKSTKHHIKRVLGESTLTFEEMTTFLTQVEACLNSRPITVDSSDPNDPLPLTPGHFLIGEPLLSVPDYKNYIESSVSSLTRWQFIQKTLQSFWHRWSQEYLSNLMNRYKWIHCVPEPQIGQLVLVKEDNLPPSRWLLGRVIEKHPGSDNITRVVTLRTKNNLHIKRPTSKLCILPIAT